MWGIKLKRYDRFFFLRRFGVWITVYTAALTAGYLLADQVCNGALTRWVEYNAGWDTAHYMIRHKVAVMMAVWLLGAAVITGVLLYQAACRIALLARAADQLAVPGGPIGPFPADLKAVELHYVQIQRALEQRAAQARQAEQRKNDLVVYLAHDLKTPLTSVVGYLSLLDETPDLPAAQRARYTRIALDKAGRLEDLINEFFEITRFSLQTIPLEREWLDLCCLLDQLQEEFYPVCTGAGRPLTVQAPARLMLWADPARLGRVFDNLLRNAVAYGAPGTPIQVTASARGGQAVVTVTSMGREIPPDKLAHIFEKFYRLDMARSARTGGAGLGLAIARQIVTSHGGTITAESAAGRTSFVLRLPLGGGPTAPPPASPAGAQTAGPAGRPPAPKAAPAACTARPAGPAVPPGASARPTERKS